MKEMTLTCTSKEKIRSFHVLLMNSAFNLFGQNASSRKQYYNNKQLLNTVKKQIKFLGVIQLKINLRIFILLNS